VAIEDFHDARKQGGGDHGVAFLREMDEVQGAIVQRDKFIVHDHCRQWRPRAGPTNFVSRTSECRAMLGASGPATDSFLTEVLPVYVSAPQARGCLND
jgi:hypothetical protein